MHSTFDTLVTPTLKAYARNSPPLCPPDIPPKRNAPFDTEPGFHEPASLWLFGNARLLDGDLAFVPGSLGPPDHTAKQLDEIERQAEELVLSAKVLVCGIHSPAQMRAAVVPLRWGAPRILILSGGFHFHLGAQLDQEPFRAARLWRYQWDRLSDLAISRRAPAKKPTFASFNPTVDRMIARIAESDWPGLRWFHGDALRVLA